MSKKAQLHELIAVEADLTNTAKAIMGETTVTFMKKPDHFMGQTRTMKYFDESRQQENETETKELVTTVDDKMGHTLKSVIRLYDALLQKEEANQRAKADLIVDGKTIAKDLPATFLLGMETRLKMLRDVIIHIPTLSPGIKWSAATGDEEGVFTSPTIFSKRTEKTVRHKVLYEATKEHPAQIEKWNEDVPVATIETTQKSGMLTPRRKADILDRLDRLLRAVKKARQRANTVEVSDVHVGKLMIDYLMKGE
jgi:hypothetical protein